MELTKQELESLIMVINNSSIKGEAVEFFSALKAKLTNMPNVLVMPEPIKSE